MFNMFNLRQGFKSMIHKSAQINKASLLNKLNKFPHKSVTFTKGDNNEEAINRFFTEHEQYIANFYKKHKENFLLNESNEAEYEDFLTRMETMMKRENKRKREIENYHLHMKKISLTGREGLKDVLVNYQTKINELGFDAEMLSETLLCLGKLFQSRENFHRVYSDYTNWEFVNSYRVYHIIEDLKFGLTCGKSYMNLHHVATAVKGLTLANYKNTQVAELVCERISSVVNKKPMDKKYERFADTPGAGKFDFFPRNSRAGMVLSQDKFRLYLKKLALVKIDDGAEEETRQEISKDYNASPSDDLSQTVNEIIHLLKEQKEVQHNLTDAIDNLLDQYYKIEQATVNNPELKNQDYIKYELFKLQDKLIEGGYLTLEALNSVTRNKLNEEALDRVKQTNMVSVMKNFVLTNFPDLYNEGERKMDSLLEDDTEEHFTLNNSLFAETDLSLGEALAALSDWAKLTSLDINGEDYVNDKIIKEFAKEGRDHDKKQITIKAEYSKLHYTVENFLMGIESSILSKVIQSNDVAALGHIYYAYANMNIASGVKQEVINRMTSLLDKSSAFDNLTNDAIVRLLVGLVKGEFRSSAVNKIVTKALTKLDIDNVTSIHAMVDLLFGVSAFKLYSSDAFIQLLIKLSEREEHLINYITNLSEFNYSLYFLSVLLKHECESLTIPENLSVLLDYHMTVKELTINKVQIGNSHKAVNKVPNDLLIDPVKDLLTRGMRDSIFSKHMTRRYSQAVSDMATLDSPFFPDLVFGFYGHKVALFLFGKDLALQRDAKGRMISPSGVNGYSHMISRVLKEKFDINAVFVPTDSLVTFDLKTVQMQTRYGNGFTAHLDRIIANTLGLKSESNTILAIDDYLNKVVTGIASDAKGDLVFASEPAIATFLNSLVHIVDLHGDVVNCFHSTLAVNRISKLVVEYEKNVDIFNSMTDNFKGFLNGIIREVTAADIDYKVFCGNLVKNYLNYASQLEVKSKSSSQNEVTEWSGKRLHVDVVSSEGVKDVACEVINNNYMWNGEYNPFDDWEAELRTNYDNFNYFVTKGDNKFLFNSHKLGHRCAPSGVFPHPTNFRRIKRPLVKSEINATGDYEHELKSYINLNETVVNAEVERNNSLSKKERDAQLSLKVNLLNINNSLKQNMKDNEIVNYLTKFEFIDALLKENLERKKNERHATDVNAAEFLSREVDSFRSFYSRMANTPQYDEYDKFLMREYYHDEKIFEMDPSKGPDFNRRQMEVRMERKLVANEDVDALSVYNPNLEHFHIDIKSILSSGKTVNQEELHNASSSDFLSTKRRQAERNLILTRIIVKLSNESRQEVTKDELDYLSLLREELKSTKVNEIKSCGLAETGTSLKFEDLSAKDTYALNSLYNVDINQSASPFSLSELALSLALFIDNSTVEKVLCNLYERLVIQKERQVTSPVFNYENKEPAMITNEVKESLWRISGFLNEGDRTKLKDMLRVKRGKSKFDKVWLQIDEQSLEDFLKEANLHEGKFKHLEQWVKRKEGEIENRLNLPPDNLQFSDAKINKMIEKKDKPYRRHLLGKIFKVEDINKVAPSAAREFTNEFLASLHSFNFNYPPNIRDIFNALEDLPALYEEDRQLLKVFRMFFGVDKESPFDYLALTPVKMEGEKVNLGSADVEGYINASLTKRIKSASLPFVSKVGERIEAVLSK